MALTVEDGTGLAAADSYISLADANTRMVALGLTTWTTGDMTDPEKEQALRRATIYMEQAYRDKWQGERVLSTQALSWPRYYVEVDGFEIDSDVVPDDVANACADLAFKAAAGDLNADQAQGIVREKVGPLETEYDKNSPQTVRYKSITDTLRPYFKRVWGLGVRV